MLKNRLSVLTRIVFIQFVLLLTQVKAEQQRLNTGTVKGRIYFAIAASPSAQTFSRTFNKTLMNITQNYLTSRRSKIPYNISLETTVIDLPENGTFSAVLLETVCEKFENKRVVALFIIGDSPAAFTVSITAKHAGIPVLWARGQGEFLPGFRIMVSSI